MATRFQGWMAVAVVAAAGALIGGCGGGGSDNDAGGYGEAGGTEAPAGPRIEVEGKEFGYSPKTLTLKAGEPTTVVLKNIGSIEHDFVVSEAKFKLTVAAAKSGQKTLTIDGPGTYKFYCTIPGHESAGMKGEITVG